MDVFRIESEAAGLTRMGSDQAATTPCLSEVEVAFAVMNPQAELERMGGLMKARLRRDAAEPLFPEDDA